MEFSHVPVMLQETIELLNVKPGGVYVDGTLGGAGHSSVIAEKMQPGGTLVGIDQDENAIRTATERLKSFQGIKIVKSNFSDIDLVLSDLGIEKVDGILLDIGVSSHQIDEGERGFSYMTDGPLDMRMNEHADLTAYKVINSYSEKELNRILKEYGEEKWAARIAKFIVEDRSKKPIESTKELADLCKRAIPRGAQEEHSHPAKRTFQAVRIEVNNELGVLRKALEDGTKLLAPGGRFVIITFHSLEDRIVKSWFNQMERPCTCPPKFPVCVCGKVPMVKVITRKPVTATEEELSINPRSKSAKLRAAEAI